MHHAATRPLWAERIDDDGGEHPAVTQGTGWEEGSTETHQATREGGEGEENTL